MIDKFSEKLNKLPKNIQDILLSDYGKRIEVEICEKYQLPKDKFSLLGEVVTLLYFKELLIDDMVEYLKKAFGITTEKAMKVASDLVGSRFLVAEDYFGVDKLRQFIRNLGGEPDKYQEYINQTKKDIQGESIEDENYINKTSQEEVPEPLFNIEKEKEDSKEIFSSMLQYFLADHVNPFLDDYNLNLIELISTDKNFKKELETLLYNNGELITHEKFEIDGGPQTPSIGNWIQDFIANNGSEIFDNLTLSNYLTNSKNARILSFDDKKIVQKLLILYRNLKFFPESMPSDDPDDWEIIPTDRFTEGLEKARFVSGPPKTEEEKEIDQIREEEEKYAVGGLERLALEEEISRKKQVEELKIVASKYRDGTLEKSAVLEEIKRLER